MATLNAEREAYEPFSLCLEYQNFIFCIKP